VLDVLYAVRLLVYTDATTVNHMRWGCIISCVHLFGGLARAAGGAPRARYRTSVSRPRPVSHPLRLVPLRPHCWEELQVWYLSADPQESPHFMPTSLPSIAWPPDERRERKRRRRVERPAGQETATPTVPKQTQANATHLARMYWRSISSPGTV